MFGLRLMLVAATAGWLGAGPTQAPMRFELPPPEKIVVPGGGVTLPMLDMGGRPVVEVMLNGKGPYRFLLDTGASLIAVNQDLEKELSLPNVADAPPGTCKVKEMNVGGAVLYGVVVAPGPGRIGAGDQNPPQGVLGASFFPGYLVTLDYLGKKVSIRKGALPPADDRTVFQYAEEDMLPRVIVHVGSHEFRPEVDSGSPSGLTLPLKASEQLALEGLPVQVGRARTPGGEFSIFSAESKESVQMGTFTLESKKINFSDVSPGPEPPAGNVGYQVLRGFVITLDTKNRRIQFSQ
jgi:Aspartyl protease